MIKYKPFNLYNFLSNIATIMMSMFPNMGEAVAEMKDQIQQSLTIKDPEVIPHMANLLANIDRAKDVGDIVHVSNVVKQTSLQHRPLVYKSMERPVPVVKVPSGQRPCVLCKFSSQHEKLKWAGFALPKQEVYMIDKHLTLIAEMFKAEEVRFWGKILGTQKDYYVMQGRTLQDGGLEDIAKGAEKRGEGVNYYSFWVTNNIYADKWTELPLITPEHIKTSRKIKKSFTGELFKPVLSYPMINVQQRFYLKAQLVRMSFSLQIVPKGIYKPNDQNAKLVEFQDEVKVPEFGELTSAQTWVHRNPNVLSLGRCSHWIDPSTPEDQLEAVTAELTEKDPEIQRLRGITEDKLPEGNPLGVENIWMSKVVGDTQVFQKDEASSVYAVAVYRNILWPGWSTVAYKGGFCNFYVGYGHKMTQPNWSEYENPNLAEEAEEVKECHEPTPKDEPKPVEQAPVQPQGEAD